MDFYKDLGQAIQNNISDNWDTVIVKIESSLNKMCSFQAEYTLSSFEKKELKFPLLTVNTLMDSVFELQESMSPEHKWNKAVYTLEKNLQESMSPEHKWNKAVYTLEKNGHFDMTFEWDQTLQDEWDNA